MKFIWEYAICKKKKKPKLYSKDYKCSIKANFLSLPQRNQYIKYIKKYHSYSPDFKYPLIGECVLPTPKGPFSVKPGGLTQINFVNPFMEDQTFNFYIDSNVFYLKTISETIKAKKTTKIIVNMQALKYLDVNIQPHQITAKLHVEVAGNPTENIKWIFYIQGDI